MNRIKALRQQMGWTQDDLAAKLNTKRQTVGHYETGIRGLDVETICRLCDIFGCTADYLLGRSANPKAAITDDEAALLQAYHAAPAEIRAIVDVSLAPYTQETPASAS